MTRGLCALVPIGLAVRPEEPSALLDEISRMRIVREPVSLPLRGGARSLQPVGDTWRFGKGVSPAAVVEYEACFDMRPF
jgi:hypothetical protein